MKNQNTTDIIDNLATIKEKLKCLTLPYDQSCNSQYESYFSIFSEIYSNPTNPNNNFSLNMLNLKFFSDSLLDKILLRKLIDFPLNFGEKTIEDLQKIINTYPDNLPDDILIDKVLNSNFNFYSLEIFHNLFRHVFENYKTINPRGELNFVNVNFNNLFDNNIELYVPHGSLHFWFACFFEYFHQFTYNGATYNNIVDIDIRVLKKDIHMSAKITEKHLTTFEKSRATINLEAIEYFFKTYYGVNNSTIKYEKKENCTFLIPLQPKILLRKL